MTTADLTEKFRRYPIPFVCGAIAFVCLVAFYFRVDLLSDLEARRNEVLDQRSQMDLNLVAGSSLQEHVVEMRSRFAALEERVVQPSELANNMNYFYQLESSTGVGLADLRQNVTSDKPAPKKQLGGVSYSVSLTGTFAQIIGYFDELENGSRYYRLRSFSLQRGRELNQSIVALSLNLELLGWQ